MDQRGRLQGMASRLVGHVVRRQSAKFFIDQRQQFLSGFGIALLDALEDLGDIAHASDSKSIRKIEKAKRGAGLPVFPGRERGHI